MSTLNAVAANPVSAVPVPNLELAPGAAAQPSLPADHASRARAPSPDLSGVSGPSCGPTDRSVNPFDILVLDEVVEEPEPIGTLWRPDALAAILARLGGRDPADIKTVLDGLVATADDRMSADEVAASLGDILDAVHSGGENFRDIDRRDYDVLSYAMRVMRESYLLASQSLSDQAAKLRSTNELRKRIRDELNLANAAILAATEAAGTSEATTPLLDPIVVKVVEARLGEMRDSVAGIDEVVSTGEHGSRTHGASEPDSELTLDEPWVTGESQLTAEERDFLDRIVSATRDGAEIVRRNQAAIAELIPKMSTKDIEKYMMPVFRHVFSGDVKKGRRLAAIKPYLDRMAPAQVVKLIVARLPLFFKQADLFEFRAIIRDALDQMETEAGVPVALDFPDLVATAFYLVEPSVKPANAVIISYREALAERAAEDDPSSLPASVDPLAPKRLADEIPVFAFAKASAANPIHATTIGQAREYVRGLEEDLNSVGEDAQLMNVDLQQSLQRMQQLLQMLSNTSKSNHDGAMAVIRNFA